MTDDALAMQPATQTHEAARLPSQMEKYTDHAKP